MIASWLPSRTPAISSPPANRAVSPERSALPFDNRGEDRHDPRGRERKIPDVQFGLACRQWRVLWHCLVGVCSALHRKARPASVKRTDLAVRS